MPSARSISPVLTGQCAATGGFADAAAGVATAMPNNRRG
jgi:hypothetical protein